MTRTDPGESPVELGFTGVGSRGESLLRHCLRMDDVTVRASCDVQDERLQVAADRAEEAGEPTPVRYGDHESMLAEEDLDGVVIATPWRHHIPMSIEAMEAGVTPAMEVGPASSVEQCRDLVQTSEETGQHCMLLENACYGRDRMAVLQMVRQGLFGELIHCQCGYLHDIRPRLVAGKETSVPERGPTDYRSLHSQKRNGDVYPTHGIGPISKFLGVHRGNRFVSLTSTATKSRGLQRWAEGNLDEDHPARDAD